MEPFAWKTFLEPSTWTFHFGTLHLGPSIETLHLESSESCVHAVHAPNPKELTAFGLLAFGETIYKIIKQYKTLCLKRSAFFRMKVAICRASRDSASKPFTKKLCNHGAVWEGPDTKTPIGLAGSVISSAPPQNHKVLIRQMNSNGW